MFIYIPGPLVALITFPGVVLHEIAHKFFCDITDVRVYDVSYFQFSEKAVGHVIYEPTNNLWRRFLISIGPLLINSLVCALLTLPIACNAYLHTTFVPYSNSVLALGHLIMAWIGYSAGFHAIPSNQDMNGLTTLAQSILIKIPLYIFTKIIALFNINGISWIFHILFAWGISMILPRLYLG